MTILFYYYNYFFIFIFQEFFAKHSVPAAVRTVQQSLENIRLNCTWLSRESNKISTWLEEKGYQNVTTDEIFEDLFTARLGCQTTLDEAPSEMSKKTASTLTFANASVFV